MFIKTDSHFLSIIKDFGVNGLNATLGSNATNTDANDPLWKTQYAVCSNIARKGLFGEETEQPNNAIGTLAVYPNPASSLLNISLAYPNDVLEKSRIIDMQGKELRQYVSQQTLLDISGIETGIYMLELTINGVLERKKIEIIK